MATAPAPREAALQPCSRFEWERIVRRCILPLKLKAFAYTLAQYGNENGREIRPGNPRLMAVCGMSERSVERYFEQLRGLGLTRRVKRGGGPSKKADEYQLTVPEDLFARVEMLDPDERTPATHMAAVVDMQGAATPVDNHPTPATQTTAVADGQGAEIPTGNNATPATNMAAVADKQEAPVDNHPTPATHVAAVADGQVIELPPIWRELPPKKALTPATQVADHQDTNQTPPKTSPEVSTSPALDTDHEKPHPRARQIADLRASVQRARAATCLPPTLRLDHRQPVTTPARIDSTEAS